MLIFVVYYWQWVIKLNCTRSNFKDIFAVMILKKVCMYTWKPPWHWLFSNLATSKTLRFWFYWKLSKFWKSCPPFWINHFVKWNFNFKFVISNPKNPCMQNFRFEEEQLLLLANFSRFPTTVCVKLTLDKKDINRRISWWALELKTFDRTLEHRSGDKMKHVDAFSRATNVMIVEDNTLWSNLVIGQNRDLKIRGPREKLAKSEDKLFEIRNGLI